MGIKTADTAPTQLPLLERLRQSAGIYSIYGSITLIGGEPQMKNHRGHLISVLEYKKMKLGFPFGPQIQGIPSKSTDGEYSLSFSRSKGNRQNGLALVLRPDATDSGHYSVLPVEDNMTVNVMNGDIVVILTPQNTQDGSTFDARNLDKVIADGFTNNEAQKARVILLLQSSLIQAGVIGYDTPVQFGIFADMQTDASVISPNFGIEIDPETGEAIQATQFSPYIPRRTDPNSSHPSSSLS